MPQVNPSWRWEMWEQFILVPVKELLELEVTCPHCKSSVVFDPRKQRDLPENCPLCREEWNGYTDRSLIEAYKGLVQFIGKFGKADMKMEAKFRVSAKEKRT